MNDRAEPRDAEAVPAAQPIPMARAMLDLEASPEAVWRALTTDRGLAPWMGEGSSLDPRPGGAVIAPDPVGGQTRRGRVDRVENGGRMDFTWWPALRPAEQTSVSITVQPSPDGSGTRIVVVERPPERFVEALSVQGLAAAEPFPAPHRSPVRLGVSRFPSGLWAWRLAVLSVATSLSRV